MRRGGREIVNRQSSIANAHGFTLVELLVVIGVLALSMGVLVPALSQARRTARSLVSSSRQRQVVLAANLYATDHEGSYPESVATALGLGRTWRWQEPRKIKACQPRADGYRASLSAYLRHYLPEADLLFCPSSPRPYPYLEDLWRAGDAWDNPDTAFLDDSVAGSYCLFWNYVGHLTDQDRPFHGPQATDGRAGCSNLLIADYFGFNHWRSPEAFGSCEQIPRAEITTETPEAADYWLAKPAGEPDRTGVQVKLRAGFVDGHVESYRPAETTVLEVAETLDGTKPAFTGAGLGAGQFFIPASGAGSHR
jgi:prepilin-type N-terminal cleavage/methylation domain-containing protein